MEVEVIYIKNGDREEPYRIYHCEICGKRVEEAWPRYESDDKILCPECAFKEGLVTGEWYVRYCAGIDLANVRACVKDGEIHVTTGKFPWEKTPKQIRHSAEYVDWRKKVFERDEFKCQICGQVGGTLNAHHIKGFAKYPKLRFDVDNGITLCEKCHKELHRNKKNE